MEPVRLPSTATERHALSAWPLTSPTFTVEAELGKGSFGVCFAATRCSPFEAPCRVALKAVPRQELAHHSREVETLRLPPRDAEPAYCWRQRLGAALGDHATSSRDARALAQLLDGILRYAPAARPTSAQASDWLEQLAPPGG